MMRVLLYTDSVGVGGAEISLGHLVATVSPEIEVAIAAVSQPVLEAISAGRPESRTILLPATGVSSVIAHLVTFHRFKPDIVHINCCTPWANAIALFAALTLPQARVIRVDQLPLRTTDACELWRTRLLSLRVDAHVAVGKGSARLMEDFYALGRDTVIPVPNCVPDLAPPPPSECPSGNLVVGSIGRLDAMKGHDLLLQAIAQVEGLDLVILGEGDQRAALEQLAQDLGISDRVKLPGWVNNPREYLPQFDLVALPSRSEGFPLAIVEAMLAARPVIATRVGSVAEAVIDGETGILIEKNDLAGLVSALKQLRDNPELRWQFGQRGREFAAANFTVEQMSDRYEKLWQDLLQRPQSPRLWIPRPKD